MNNFNKLNTIIGWVLFAIATTVFWMTVEPTASYWDCGEFISVSYKLEVPHPPGAPFFLLVGRIFSFLAFGDVYKVAYWINIISVLSSGFTILFLFWAITLFARKLMQKKDDELTQIDIMVLMASGIVGALAYTFSDTFWFSAVEAEVYAMSSFFAAFVVWAMLKWERVEDESIANKWLLLIFYMMGLSIGVHLLNLVTIPALGLIYYFKKYQPTTRGVIITMAISGAIILFVNNFVIPGLPSVAAGFERYFVNSLGLPFYSGTIFFGLIVCGLIVYGIYKSHINGNHQLNTILLALSFILIGYSTYSLVLIRSTYNPPIDENNPENLMSFVSYLKREQYGSRPLVYGQYFDAEIADQKSGAPVWVKGEDEYEISQHKLEYVYNPDRMTILPRAYSSQQNHIANYRKWMNLKANESPNFADNLEFMFRYQLGYMYMRYFLWNFAGRESDIQGADWLSPLDSLKEIPQQLKENKGRNTLFMLPLLLGLLGLFFNYRKSQQVFSIIILLFFMLGMALVLYLNSPPVEPRERDYIYTGSFYAYAIWIGLGVMALYQLLLRIIKNNKIAIAIAFSIGMVIPVIMAIENWDDHDRSDRYFSVDTAKNFLDSCEPNAILFTGGDNDTFPLWYVQEVEGFRTDVRVIVLSYFNTDWYIDQMTRPAYDSESLPFGLDPKLYRQGGPNDYLPYIENPSIGQSAINLGTYMRLVRQDRKEIKVPTTLSSYNALPSKSLYLNVNKEDILAKGIIPEGMEDNVVDQMVFRVKKNGIEKNTLMILDLLTNSNWERPIYFNNTSLQGVGIDVNRYVVQEGNAYRLLPIENPRPAESFVNTEVMYTNVMEKFSYREMNNPDVYYTEDYRNFTLNHRTTFNTLAQHLIRKGDIERAKLVVEKNLEVFPDNTIPFDYTTVQTVSLLYQIGEKEKGKEVAKLIADRAEEFLAYYTKNELSPGNEVQKNMVVMNEMARVFKREGEDTLATKYETSFMKYYELLNK